MIDFLDRTLLDPVVLIVVAWVCLAVVVGLLIGAVVSRGDKRVAQALADEKRARLEALDGMGDEFERVAWIFGEDRPPLVLVPGGREDVAS